jgi:tetratricopeptide (TPR) repeat protein
MTETVGSFIGYLISFALGVYMAVATLVFRRAFYSTGLLTSHQAMYALGAACLWPIQAVLRAISVRPAPARAPAQALPSEIETDELRQSETEERQKAEREEAAKIVVRQRARYERLQNVEDTDEAYRLCLEFLQAQPIKFGAYTSHVPYAEMLRQSVSTAQADGPRMLHMLGLIALAQHDFKTMRRLLDRAVHADPNDAEIHNSLGYGLCQERKFLSASIVLMRAATLRPDLAVAELNLSLARVGLSGGET